MNKTVIENIEIIDNAYEWKGYRITMNDKSKNIICKISDGQLCCEEYGYYTKSDINIFIGAEYYSMNYQQEWIDDYCNQVTININTNVGCLVLYLYNSHNGYYLHDVSIEYDNKTMLLQI